MLEKATVVSVTDKLAQVKLLGGNACQSCSLQSGCGTGSLGKLLGFKSRPLQIQHSGDLKPGDHIQLEIDDVQVVKAGLLMYLLPVCSMLVIASISSLFGIPDVLVGISGLLGFVSGLLLVRKLAGKMAPLHLKHQLLPSSSVSLETMVSHFNQR